MFVSRNEDKSLDLGQKQFKYSTGLEKTKLFVKGLPFSLNKPKLEDIFKTVSCKKKIMQIMFYFKDINFFLFSLAS